MITITIPEWVVWLFWVWTGLICINIVTTVIQIHARHRLAVEQARHNEIMRKIMRA